MVQGTPAQDQLALLCTRLADDAGPLVSAGTMRELATSITDRIRAGQDPAELADDFDQLDDLLLRAGYAAGLGTYRSAESRFGPLPGFGDGHPLLEVSACPEQRCARVELPVEGFTCAVFGEALRRIRLRP